MCFCLFHYVVHISTRLYVCELTCIYVDNKIFGLAKILPCIKTWPSCVDKMLGLLVSACVEVSFRMK